MVSLVTDEGAHSYGTVIDVVIGVVFGLAAAAPLLAAFALCGEAWVRDGHWWAFLPPTLVFGILVLVVVAEGLAGEGILWWLIPVGLAVIALAFLAPWVWHRIRHEDVRHVSTSVG